MFQAVNFVFVLFMTINGREKLAAFYGQTNTHPNLLEKIFLESPSSCQYSYWIDPSCRYFDPVCNSNGKVYKNKCFLKAALCNDSSLRVQGDSQQCIKGKLLHKVDCSLFKVQSNLSLMFFQYLPISIVFYQFQESLIVQKCATHNYLQFKWFHPTIKG